MNENKFIKKLQHKTNWELESILENKQNYNEQAVYAAIYILKERNVKLDETQTIEDEIKAEKEKKKIEQKNVIQEVKKKTNITDDPSAPELHSKKTIMAFSILFSTIFGAVLLMYNMTQTKNKTGRIQVLVFGILYTAIILLVVNLLNIGGNIAMVFNIGGGAILNDYFWNKFIGKEFEHRKRSWVKPAIISVLITIPIIVAAFYGE